MRDSISVSKYGKGWVNGRIDDSVCWGDNIYSCAEVCRCVDDAVNISNVEWIPLVSLIEEYFEYHGVTLLDLYYIGIYINDGIRRSGCVICVNRYIGSGKYIDFCSSVTSGDDG